MDFLDVIKARRSVRRFKDIPVDEAVIREMLHAAQLAPSGGNGQEHVFGIITDGGVKTALARAAGGQMWIAQAPVVIACCARLGADLKDLPDDDFGLTVNRLRFGELFLDYLNGYVDRAAVGTLFANAVPLIPAEHMFLTAVSHGLSACFIGYLDVKEAGRVLGLPADIVCLFLLPVGYADEQPEEKERKSIEQISFNNRYTP